MMKLKYRKNSWVVIVSLIVIPGLLGCSRVATSLFGEARGKQDALPLSNIELPRERSLNWEAESKLADSIYASWAAKPFGSWQEEGKVNMPRKLLGNLLSGTNIPAVNEYILELEPWGVMGSTWAFNRSGDYDFTLTVLTSILFLFDDKEELLYPETKAHMLNVLLVAEGEDFVSQVPRTQGLIRDTENHLLMGEGSRYLKNRYLRLHGDVRPEYNNIENGLEFEVLGLLKEIKEKGLYEFNSIPYLGYTITALLNLEAFGSAAVRLTARDALDLINYNYALGSYKFRYYPPFRRRLERASVRSLSKDYSTPMMQAWLSYLPDYEGVFTGVGLHHALLAACMPYRPSDEIVNLVLAKESEYFVKIGHGKGASPELYSSGPGYLLSAGGVSRGRKSSIVARPICLFLNDTSTELHEVFHIKGKSESFMKWNNTGVYKNFACANGQVHVPEAFTKLSGNELWSIYEKDDLRILVHSGKEIGIIVVFGAGDVDEEMDFEQLEHRIYTLNSDAKQLQESFAFPDGRIVSYDVNAAKRLWVIKEIDGVPLERNHEDWPILERY